jgi:DNA-binding NarL/FixJ family response regulator
MANKNSVTFVEPITFINEKKVTSISYKSPLRSRNGKILGVIGLSIVQYEKQAHDVTRFLKSGLKIPSLIKGVTITNREKDILNLLACGHTARKIAETLSLSPRTVEHHIENIKNKTGAANKAELIQMLIKESGS